MGDVREQALTSAGVGCSRRRRFGLLDAAGWRWFRRLRGWRVRRSIAAKTIWTRRLCRPGASAARAAADRRSATKTPDCAMRCVGWSSRTLSAIRRVLWFGCRKAWRSWPPRWRRWASCWGSIRFARELRKLGFSRQGNRKAEEGSRHADRDGAVPIHRCDRPCGAGSRRAGPCPSTRRRRNGSAISRTPARTIGPRASRCA